MAGFTQATEYRLMVNLPKPLALYIQKMTSGDSSYSDTTEFICDLVRRHMEKQEPDTFDRINKLLIKASKETFYSEWSKQNIHEIYTVIGEVSEHAVDHVQNRAFQGKHRAAGH